MCCRSTHRQCLYDMWSADRYGSGRHLDRPTRRNDQVRENTILFYINFHILKKMPFNSL